jgi:glycosyltransferase involved in cell wall biosynthesis
VIASPGEIVRILLDYRPALRERSGVGEYVHEMARALVATAPADESITLFSSSLTDRLDPNAVPGTKILDRRIPVMMLNFLWHRLELPSVDGMPGAPFDVVQSAHPLLMPSRRAARVVTLYDLDFLDHPERTRREIRRDYPALAASHARRADRIVAISEHTANDVTQRLGVERGQISVCYPGAPAWMPREREPENGTILFLGTLEPRKNLGVLLDAYEQLLAQSANVPSLVLAGRATPEAGDLLKRANTPPLNGRVRMPGYIPDERRVDVYREALVLVLPSHTEGFGMPVAEAMTVGVPVIAANRGALPEVVGTAGRLFEPDDAKALAALLAQVLASPAARHEMREAGLRQAQRFEWQTSARRLREAWTLAVEHRKTRRG